MRHFHYIQYYYISLRSYSVMTCYEPLRTLIESIWCINENAPGKY